jgi:iron complex outermembrane receptor protein
VDAKPLPHVDLHAGIGYADAKISNGVLYWQPTGSRVYQVPKITANASATFTVPVSSALSSFLTIDGSYVSDIVSGVSGCEINLNSAYHYFPCPPLSATDTSGLAATRAGYHVVNARMGLDWGQSELALFVNNLTNERANLGDFNPEGYTRHSTNPVQYDGGYGAGWLIPRAAVLRPFVAGLSFRQRF